MAISTNWIKDYVDIDDVNLEDLADLITKAGINIESVDCKYIAGLVVGEVLECSNHPDSDHLHVCKVDIGTEILDIVCGASNVRKGLKVVVATNGAKLPGDFTINKTTIRGVESNGMICALYELGFEEKTEERYNAGIEELNNDAPVGEDACKYLGYDDTSYTLDLNPNRTDCNNHIPFSYEVAAVLKSHVTLPDTSTSPIKDSVKDHMKVVIDTPNCSMYNAKMVTNVKIGESPEFIKRRLIIAGMRSINNVVDISNYIMLEYGQPLHFFDKEKLGDTILVRMATENEKIITLDKEERELSGEDIVITNGTKPICIAGVMGSDDSGIDENTTTIVIESAIFSPLNVRYTSINHDLRSEASLRFEKGLNYEYCTEAIERACHLLEKYAGATVLSDTIVHDKTDKTEKEVEFHIDEINKLLGMFLTTNDINSSLDGLGFTYNEKDSHYIVQVPTRRLDVLPRVCDLAEEIGRIYGYDNIKGILPTIEMKRGEYIGDVKTRKQVTKRLRSLGLNEVRTYTLISDTEDKLFSYNRKESIPLLRPLSNDRKVLRQSLLSSLLKTYEYNKSHNVKDVNIYEIANVYYDEDKEESKIAILMTGEYITSTWQGQRSSVDFYLLKGIVENILIYLGLKNRYTFVKEEINDLHPGISASITLDREPVGIIGKVHPNISKDDLYVAEISLSKLLTKQIKPIKYKEISKYPNIVKDMAFILKDEIDAESIVTTIKRTAGRLLTDIKIFDVYKGERVNADKKSIAFSLTFNDPTKTLTEDEVMPIFHKVIDKIIEEYDAILRDK